MDSHDKRLRRAYKAGGAQERRKLLLSMIGPDPHPGRFHFSAIQLYFLWDNLDRERPMSVRFEVAQIWRASSGLRGVVIEIDDGGWRGRLLFESGEETWVGRAELAAGWNLDLSSRPQKSAIELAGLLKAKMTQQSACPPGMDVFVRPTGNGKWVADTSSPNYIAYADCANYVGHIAVAFGLLFDLK